MPATVEQLEHEALLLPEADRAHFAQILLRSLDIDVEADVEKDWDAEVARRMEKVTSGEAKGRAAEDVFRDLRARFSPQS